MIHDDTEIKVDLAVYYIAIFSSRHPFVFCRRHRALLRSAFKRLTSDDPSSLVTVKYGVLQANDGNVPLQPLS